LAWWCHHAGVVEQQIQMAVLITENGNGPLNGAKVSEIDLQQIEASQAFVKQLTTGRFPSASASTSHDNRRTFCGKGAGGFKAEADVGSGHYGNAALLGGNVVNCPSHRWSVFREEQFG
jgi:hypothetical protein